MPGSETGVIRVGARGSKLSLAQTREVIELLSAAASDYRFELVIITTTGDLDKNSSLASIGGTGVFVKELEAALSRGEIDLAVHSAKDLPAILPDGFSIAAVPDRAPVEDVLISKDGQPLRELPQGARIATGSPRRIALARMVRPDLRFVEVRGNVDTRLRKLDEGQFDAIILARAGLVRLNLEHRITQILSPDEFLPAPGQGALAVECRMDDETVMNIAGKINSEQASATLKAERSMLGALKAGCSVPVGGRATIEADGRLKLDAIVLDHQGGNAIRVSIEAETIKRAESLGKAVAEKLIMRGAVELLSK